MSWGSFITYYLKDQDKGLPVIWMQNALHFVVF